jgi:hypothetical protein
MRTKTILLSAAVLAAGLSAVSAQSVFSVNAVGYVNIPVVSGYQIVANPLNNSNNTLSVILPLGAANHNTKIYKFNPANSTFGAPSTFSFDPEDGTGLWFPDVALNPGEGVFLFSPIATTLTFVGEVPQGTLSNPLPPNYSIRSSIVPQTGGISSALGLTAQNNDTVYFFNPAIQNYVAPFTFLFDDETNTGVWSPSEPSPAVGQGFFFRNTSGIVGRSWNRTFSVN